MISKIFSILSILFLIYSCDSDNIVSPDIEKLSVVTSISGTIKSWEKGTTGIVRLMVQYGIRDTISTSPIDENGYFNLIDLKDIDSEYLLNHVYPQYIDDLDYIDNSVVCSDSSAGYMPSYIFAYKDSNEVFWNELLFKNSTYPSFLVNERLSTYNSYMEFVYVDKDADLYGDVETHFTNGLLKIENINHYDLKYKKGWNAKVTHIIHYNTTIIGDTTFIETEYSINNLPTQPMYWDKY